MIKALIMAGGKGTRMKYSQEKPLIKINGRPMIGYVIDALNNSKKIDEIIVSTSSNTPRTKEFAEKKGIQVIETPGKGYVEDLGIIISKLDSNSILLTIAADLPLLSSDLIDFVLNEYEKCGKPAMCVVLPLEIFENNNLKPSMVFDGIVPSGLNILRCINKIQDEEVLILSEIELALNINTCEDIKLIEKFLG
ncbi:MAG: TIGR00454 family protein [Methanobacteriaceae archaeon]|nr:TIGR00454 family protein [Methanobacteriaceae archaeon]